MKVHIRQPPPPASSVVPGTRDCSATNCGARQGMLLRELVHTADGTQLIYVCEQCGAEVTISR